MAANADSEYQLVMKLSRERGVPTEDAEQEIFGATHAQVGAYLLGLWGLPEPVVSNVELHHSLAATVQKGFSPVTAIHVAQCLDTKPSGANRLDLDYLRQIGMDDRVSDWQRILLN
jgi:HD-like signal output (HDOD) protein